ncbi:hypothetical protein NECAME_00903 [Necator americanus]|uniref:Uncharacterized protein n=1 Tax=Necator americanus TaxID=51031 RepID=W2SNF3_NECAM|nr:hypothetical protein NECAME_00903 [Necator americanus]ETN71214.1 hypothetical protein NECAME_00903 [Necator americanus]
MVNVRCAIVVSTCLLWLTPFVFCEFPSCLTTTPSESISLNVDCKRIDTSVEVSNNCAGSVRLYAFFEPIETGMRSMFYKVKQGATASIILSRAIRKWTWNGLLNEAAVVIYAWTNLKDPRLEQIWQKTLNGTLSCA